MKKTSNKLFKNSCCEVAVNNVGALITLEIWASLNEWAEMIWKSKGIKLKDWEGGYDEIGASIVSYLKKQQFIKKYLQL